MMARAPLPSQINSTHKHTLRTPIISLEVVVYNSNLTIFYVISKKSQRYGLLRGVLTSVTVIVCIRWFSCSNTMMGA